MEEGWNGVSEEAKDFVQKLLEKDVEKRLSAA
jgi:serine/threonine protein kinase